MVVFMERPTSREAVRDIFLYMLPVYLPFYQALLLHGMGRAIVFLLLAVLLMFLVAHEAEIRRVLATCLYALCSAWLAPPPAPGVGAPRFETLTVPRAPILAPLFERPPPSLA
jgi:hypothetical protein